jgi:hypothetical protein
LFSNNRFPQLAEFKAGTKICSVIEPASTGNESNNKIAVTNIAHENKLILCKFNPPALIFKTVLIKLIAPNKLDIPDKCNEKIAKSTEPPECDCIPARGG